MCGTEKGLLYVSRLPTNRSDDSIFCIEENDITRSKAFSFLYIIGIRLCQPIGDSRLHISFPACVVLEIPGLKDNRAGSAEVSIFNNRKMV